MHVERQPPQWNGTNHSKLVILGQNSPSKYSAQPLLGVKQNQRRSTLTPLFPGHIWTAVCTKGNREIWLWAGINETTALRSRTWAVCPFSKHG